MAINKNINIEPTKMEIPQAYEPMRKNRWLISFKTKNKIQQWWLKSTDRPTLTKGFWSWLIGHKIDDMDVVFYEPIGESLSSILLELFENDVKVDFTLEMLDPTGVSIESWLVEGCQIVSLDYGELGYGKDELSNITAKFRPKSIKIKH